MSDEKICIAAFENDAVSRVIASEIFRDKRDYSSQRRPRAILLAGQPGAGKTGLSAMMVSRLGGDSAFINADDYRRYHPNYRRLYGEYGSDSVQKTSAFSSAVANGLIDQLSDLKINLVIEGTGRTVDVPKSTAEFLCPKGYTVEIAVIAARPEISLISTLLRFYKMNEGGTIPRATAIAAHDYVVDNLPSNLDVLNSLSCISSISIWDRELQLLYDSNLDLVCPSEVLLQFWQTPWNHSELTDARAQVELLRENELQSNLGQGAAIDELERRLKNASQNITPAFDMTLG